jgi:acyl-CoA thioester hydrolase
VDELRDYPVIITFPVMWGDMDALGHVNNVHFFRYFESVRTHYFYESGLIDRMKETGIGPILAEASCRFRRPVAYPDTLTAAARTVSFGEYSAFMEYIVVSEKAGIAAVGKGEIVTFDFIHGKKVRVPEEIIRAFEKIEGRSIERSPLRGPE